MSKFLVVFLAVLLAALLLPIAWQLLLPPLQSPSRIPHTREVRTRIELSTLTSATRMYESRMGRMFPIRPHLHVPHIRQTKPESRNLKEALADADLDILQMDDAEALVFYLSGRVDEVLGLPQEPVFEFDEQRLTDVDKDGFPEFQTAWGETYRFDGSLPMVYSNQSDTWLVMPDFETTNEARRAK